MLFNNCNFCILLLFLCNLNGGLCEKSVDVDVGLVLHMESWIGKSIHSSIMMALTDFYTRNGGCKTKIVVHIRDSKGDQLQAISSVLDLLNTVKVHAIIGPETYIGSELLGSFSDKKPKVPIFCFACKSLSRYPYMFQIKEDESAMAKSIAAVIESYKWRGVIFMHEETNQGSDLLQYLLESFQDKNILITYRSVISNSAKHDQINQELHKVMSFHTTIVIVDMSPSLASMVFLNAKRLGMMTKEYAWILTQKTIEILQSDDLEVIESLQGAIGLRSYIPASSRLHYLTKRWKKEFSREMPMLSIWAYDTIWALAESIEKVGVLPQNGSILLSEIFKINGFKGMSGEFRLSERKVVSNGFEIVNAIDYGERKVGYWTLSKGIRRAHRGQPHLNDAVSYSRANMEDVIWHEGSTTTPKGVSIGTKLRIGVRTGLKFKYFVNAVYDNKTKITTATGFSVEVFKACIHALPYEVAYELIPFEKGSYDELIKKVHSEEIDGLLGDSTILANRSELVDFTATYTDLGFGTLAKNKEKDMWIFLKPLDVKLWLTVAAFVIFTGFIVWAIEAMNQESKISSSQRIGTIFWLILLTIFSAQKEKLSSNLSRLVIFSWLFLVLILISSYTATLSALMTVEQFELASNGGIVGFHGGSFFGGVTINNMNFTDDDLKQKSYYNFEDYAKALSKGGKNGGADAIVDEVPYIKMFLGKYPNGYAMVSSQPTTSGFGFVFGKSRPLLTKDMSRAIAKIREDGILQNLEKKWFENEFDVLPQESSKIPKTLTLDRFGGLFVISGISSALALVIAVLYLVRAKIEMESIISLVAGRNLMATIRYLLHRNVIHRYN